MHRRAFLNGAMLAAAVPRALVPASLAREADLDPDEDEQALIRDLRSGRYRLLGRTPETYDVVVTVALASEDRATLLVHTVEQYADPEGSVSVRAPVRRPMISVLGPTPYRVEVSTGCDERPPNCTTFIRFMAAVVLEVRARLGSCDHVVLLEAAWADPLIPLGSASAAGVGGRAGACS